MPRWCAGSLPSEALFDKLRIEVGCTTASQPTRCPAHQATCLREQNQDVRNRLSITEIGLPGTMTDFANLVYDEISVGAIAQLGERYNGIVEVTGSIPVGSTTFPDYETVADDLSV